ncbi:nitroreductase family protein, partial [Methylogaea oryzae]|uniref:nitroreductase family protein n=1 Tax=Methylogaea oryzae TaxID=1295382 RepID=UPI00156BB685
ALGPRPASHRRLPDDGRRPLPLRRQDPHPATAAGAGHPRPNRHPGLRQNRPGQLGLCGRFFPHGERDERNGQENRRLGRCSFIGQNVYLYCASERLATVVRGSIDEAALAKAMGLKPQQRIVLSQSVGYPKP